MDPHITKAMRLIDDATTGLSDAALTGRTDQRWSPAQVLEHLSRAFGGTAKLLEQQVASGNIVPMAPLTLKDRIVIFTVITLGYLPEGRPAPQPTIPSDSPEGLSMVARAKENLLRVGRVLGDCEKKWGTSMRIFPHPILGPLTAPQVAKFHFVHTRHHMKQVRERAAQNLARAAAR